MRRSCSQWTPSTSLNDQDLGPERVSVGWWEVASLILCRAECSHLICETAGGRVAEWLCWSCLPHPATNPLELYNNLVLVKMYSTLHLCKYIRNTDIIKFYFIFLRFYLFIFTESGREGEREGEKHPCVVPSHMPLTRDPVCNPGMCPRLGIEPATL